LFCGKPLIAWTIEAALAAESVDTVIVSTEDDEIGRIAREFGASVPFMRPAELASDETPGIEPVLHAIDRLPGYDSVVLLQPTSPLRSSADIDGCVRLATKRGAPAAVTVSEASKHPYWMYTLQDGERLSPLIKKATVRNRQALPPVYALNGAAYYAKTEWLRAAGNFVTEETVGYVMPPERSVDLDSALDWEYGELLMKRAK
jgi:CMP-N-acetylneuraminic acid synthetase